MIYITHLKTFIGIVKITATNNHVIGIDFVNKAGFDRPNEITNLCVKQLTEYFDGRRKKFTVPIFYKGTPFQMAVWKALTKIPYGETASYVDIAKQINNPKACRAVGTANGKNPISIVIPCHRIILADGRLGGYTGGIDKKIALLNIEQR